MVDTILTTQLHPHPPDQHGHPGQRNAVDMISTVQQPHGPLGQHGHPSHSIAINMISTAPTPPRHLDPHDHRIPKSSGGLVYHGYNWSNLDPPIPPGSSRPPYYPLVQSIQY